MAYKAEFRTNKFGNPQIEDAEGFVYSMHKATGHSVQWRCNRRSIKEGWACKARATTEGDLIVKRFGQHQHLP